MIFKEFIDTELGHVSYIIGCEESNKAVIIDPRRDIEEYIQFLESKDLNLEYILNTHTHADYIGGHLEFTDRYKDVKNIFHHDVPTGFESLKVKENDNFSLSSVLKFKVIETPGHTPYCISFLFNDNGIDSMLFTGDFLFVGDIGRPDLLGKENIEKLLESSYKSAKKLSMLDDFIIIFSSHIQGSFCGKSLQNEYFSTIGLERLKNYSFSLSFSGEKEYIENLRSQKIETPSFFKKMAIRNIEGPRLLKEIGPVKKVEDIADENFQLIDIREPGEFRKGYLRNSINIYENANLPLIAGSLLGYEKQIVLIGNKSSDYDNVIKRLYRVGFDNITYYLDIHNCNEDQLITAKFGAGDGIIINLDMENPIESGNTVNLEISMLKDYAVPLDKEVYIRCKNGMKSSAAISYMNSLGFNNVLYKK